MSFTLTAESILSRLLERRTFPVATVGEADALRRCDTRLQALGGTDPDSLQPAPLSGQPVPHGPDRRQGGVGVPARSSAGDEKTEGLTGSVEETALAAHWKGSRLTRDDEVASHT